MPVLELRDFEPFFEELWGCSPFPWQQRLARQVCEGHWPDYIDLPTASGKTACLDIAVFALALQAAREPEKRTVGRRIFFVVNRRVIVDEAHERALKMARTLSDAKPGSVVALVAEALRAVSGDRDAPPLDVAVLRGGIVRDNRWARSITQPTIITSTIDQVGSRLLFRGYGVSDAAKPLHAALVAHDSLLLLDEAHISQPFVETLNAVKRYRGSEWAQEPLQTPFNFVQMTATPADSDEACFKLDRDDRAHPELEKRHGRAKPVELCVASKAKGRNALEELAKDLAGRAVDLSTNECRNVAIVVNRIATARMVAGLLPELLRKGKKPESDVHLAIGRMRPIDRDELTRNIQERVGHSSEQDLEAKPMFVVATQCLEVGADFDFDAMVTECASLDALRQRFGRLNRRGRDIKARGIIVIRADQVKEDPKNEDPIYGLALPKAWAWLESLVSGEDDTVDFGIHAMDDLLRGVDTTEMLAPRVNAPVMFPAYVDAWAQTHPKPTPDPDVSLFLHGPQRGEPDVQVCWRDDLATGHENQWVEIVSLCPPTSPECMSVPIGVVRRWLAEQDAADEERSDLFDGHPPESADDEGQLAHNGVLWRGVSDSKFLESPADLRPGDTLVLPVQGGGWDIFGHIPEKALKDVAEEAHRLARGRVLLRLLPARLEHWPTSDALLELRAWLDDPEENLSPREVRALLAEVAPERIKAFTGPLCKHGFQIQRYPNGQGVVLQTRHVVDKGKFIPALDDGEDTPSWTPRPAPVRLSEHHQHVFCELDGILNGLALNGFGKALSCAVELHDLGKADGRFQAMLIDGDINDALAQPHMWAKSGAKPTTVEAQRQAYKRSGLPAGFRHEMLSVQLAELAEDKLPSDDAQRDLALHLIAAHHGRGRPFAPVVLDDEPPEVDLARIGLTVRLTTEMRKGHPPHRLDSGIAERFWKLTRRYGWWGLAYLEAVARLSDQRASQREAEDAHNHESAEVEQEEAKP